MAIKITQLSINLPFGIGGIDIAVSEGQRRAAWALYVELSTRVATTGLEAGTGSAREALSSLHSLFATTREVLREAGTEAAEGPRSVGPLAIRILNDGLRPFLVKWHTRLSDFENRQRVEQREHYGEIVIDEARWADGEPFFAELQTLRLQMLEYVEALARIAGVAADDEAA